MESNVVSGIAYSRDEAKMTLISVADRPGIAAAIFGPLSEAGINVDMIIQNIAEEGRTDMTFSCPTDQVLRAEKHSMMQRVKAKLIFRNLLQILMLQKYQLLVSVCEANQVLLLKCSGRCPTRELI